MHLDGVRSRRALLGKVPRSARAFLAALACAAPARGAVMQGLADDCEVRAAGNAVGDVRGSELVNGRTALEVGSAGGDGSENTVGVFVFDLPALAPGESFGSASFTAGLDAKIRPAAGFGFNLDLYALGPRATASVSRVDFYVGAFGGDPTDATPLADNFATDSTPLGAVSSSGGQGAGAATLAAYLNGVYADAGAGDRFLFLRVSPDANPPGSTGALRAYSLTAAEEFDEPGVVRPFISYTIVPEPACAPLLLAAGWSLRRGGRR